MTDERRMTKLGPETPADRSGFEKKRLSTGEAPDGAELLRQLSVDIDFTTDSWQEHRLKEYVQEGGNKIKFVTGRSGSRKSHLPKYTAMTAGEKGYVTAELSAHDVWIRDLKEIYIQTLCQADTLDCLRCCHIQAIKNLGFTPEEIPRRLTFMDHLSQNDLEDATTRREIRLQLKSMFLENPLVDNNLALACSLLTGGTLGHPFLEDQNRQILLS